MCSLGSFLGRVQPAARLGSVCPDNWGPEPRATADTRAVGTAAGLGAHQLNSASGALHLTAETVFKITLNWVVDGAKAPPELQTKLSHLLLAEILQM